MKITENNITNASMTRERLLEKILDRKNLNKAKMKDRIRELTSRSNGWGNDRRIEKLKSYITGWVNYFKIANMKNLLSKINDWMRRRIRMVFWKQWKRVKTRYKMLRALGDNRQKAFEFANTRKSYWRISNSPILKKPLSNDILRRRGIIFFSRYYRQVTTQTMEAPYTERYVRCCGRPATKLISSLLSDHWIRWVRQSHIVVFGFRVFE